LSDPRESVSSASSASLAVGLVAADHRLLSTPGGM
jgi:hypothetical protein